MSSGRKQRIMIACVTFETVKISDPVEYYEANKVYLIHHSSEKHPVYQEFYDRTVELIDRNSNGKVKVIEVHEKLWEFSTMLRTVVAIIDGELEKDTDCEIYVNISAGSPEYTAAAAIGSMMYDPKIVIPFAVSGDEYTVQEDADIRECYYASERDPVTGNERLVPIGLSKSTKEPVRIPNFYIKKPSRDLVLGLKIYRDHSEKEKNRYRRVTAPAVIEDLKAAGLWNHSVDPSDSNRVKNEKSSNAVYFHRDFIERWLKHQWVERDDTGKRYILTDEGRRIIETFYTDVNYDGLQDAQPQE